MKTHYAGLSFISVVQNIKVNHIDSVLQVDLLVPDYTGESWLTFLLLNPIDLVMQV